MSTIEKKKKRFLIKKYFANKWICDLIFIDWIKKDINKTTFAWYTVCNKKIDLSSTGSDLSDHAKRKSPTKLSPCAPTSLNFLLCHLHMVLLKLEVNLSAAVLLVMLLIHFRPIPRLCTPWYHMKSRVFLRFQRV